MGQQKIIQEGKVIDQGKNGGNLGKWWNIYNIRERRLDDVKNRISDIKRYWRISEEFHPYISIYNAKVAK